MNFMQPSTFQISDRIEAIRMFVTFFQYEDPMSDSFLENALPAAKACKWIGKNPNAVLPSLSNTECDKLVEMVNQVADRMEQYKNDLLQKFDQPEEDYNEYE